MSSKLDTLAGTSDPSFPPAQNDAVRRLPPSSKLVWTVLQHEGALTQQELVSATRLHSRTVRDAARRLEDAGILERRVYLPDARKHTYHLTVERQ